ncbi:hypothetical protein GCM10028791_09140 [Echinicola sediminis]
MVAIRKLVVVVVLLCFQACNQEFSDEIVIYENDFSDGNLENVENGILSTFENDNVLGFYNNGEVKFFLPELPKHNAIRVTLDVYLHDTWDGNFPEPGGPDIWYMMVDDQQVINTTFSNSICNPRYCLYQSFPDAYPNHLNPKTGVINGNLPGRCSKKNEMGFTSRYIITKIIPHKSQHVMLKIGDRLVQDNTGDPMCDESWSLNGISVSTIEK